MKAAAAASLELHRILPGGAKIDITLTPEVTGMSTDSHQRQGGDLRGRGPVSLDLSTCVNPYGPPDTVMQALRSLPPERHPEPTPTRPPATSRRPTPPTSASLPASWSPGRGTSDLIWTLARQLDGKTTGLPLPAYTEFRQAFPQARTFGGGPSTHPLEILDDAMRACDAVIISNPHNPTGQLLHRGDLAESRKRTPAACWWPMSPTWTSCPATPP